MGGFLSHIGNVQLKEDPARVACAVDEILKLFDRLEITVKQTAASENGSRRLVQGRLGSALTRS